MSNFKAVEIGILHYMKTILLSLAICLSINQSQKVYICKSGTSYAYHNSMCKGLSKCTHKIEKVTVEEAIASGHKKACGYCYK